MNAPHGSFAAPVPRPDAPAFALTYTLRSVGWADAVVQFGDRTAEMTVSYLCDGLADLAAAVLALTQDQRQVAVSWMTEPGEHLWLLSRYTDDEQAGPAQDRVAVRLLSDTATVLWDAPPAWLREHWARAGTAIETLEDGQIAEPIEGGGLDTLGQLDLPRIEFVAAIVQTLDSVLAAEGVDGYARRWNGADMVEEGDIPMPFPLDALERLRAWLEAARREQAAEEAMAKDLDALEAQAFVELQRRAADRY